MKLKTDFLHDPELEKCYITLFNELKASND